MKKNLLNLCVLLLLSYFSVAQEGVKVAGNTVSTKEISPVWPGCEKSDLPSKVCFNKKMSLHIKEHFKYPRDNQGNLVRGASTLTFFIDEKGGIKNVSAEGPHKQINEEAIRIVQLFPAMTPGKRAGQPVSIKFKMPFNF